MITRTASVYFSGGRYVFAASTKMPEGFWQVCHVSDAIETVETREIGKLTLDALSRSGGAVKGVFANSRASVAGKMLGFKSEKSFVGATRSVMVEFDDGRVRVTRMDSDLKYKAVMYTEDVIVVDPDPDAIGDAVESFTRGAG